MAHWFNRTVVETGRLPLFFLLVAFVLTFLFIRFSVRMIRAEVSWWPGNVTPGGMHVHHVVFGLGFVLVSGFAFIALANYETPVANCVLASLFGIGSALVLDEFALVLHLRDVYWAEEGRASVDAVFVAVAITALFLLGVHPVGFSGDFTDYSQDHSPATLSLILVVLAIQLGTAVVTLLKGKVWTGLIGLFFVPLLIVGAIRLSRPGAPWARWRYRTRPAKQAKAVSREHRFREPVVRAKIVVQEALSGRFGVPEEAAPPPDLANLATPNPSDPRGPSRAVTSLRWRRTRRRLRQAPVWRLPAVLIVLAAVAALILSGLDDDSVSTSGLDTGTTAALLSAVAGGMITLTGLVFTAITLAMQFGAAQLSVRVVPLLQHEPVMRWSVGMFLATFVFSLLTALDLAGAGAGAAPLAPTLVAVVLTLISAFLFLALVAKVGTILNSSRLLRWIASQGRTAVTRAYPEGHHEAGEVTVPAAPAAAQRGAVTVVRLRQLSPEGRVLLAVDLARLQRLATRWGVTVAVQPSIGEFVAHQAPLFEVVGPALWVRPYQLTSCLVFGDTHSPAVSPAAVLQSIVDIALKGLSPAINDPGRAVQALDHLEDLLSMLAPRVLLPTELTRVRGHERTWADYVSVATDEIRHFSTGSTQVQRRLRAVFETLLATCPPEQHPPLLARLAALDGQVRREWSEPLDRRLASSADPQGLGSESGTATRVDALVVGPESIGQTLPESIGLDRASTAPAQEPDREETR